MLVVKLECKRCGNVFDFNPSHYSILGLKDIPKRCPKCVDEENKLEKVVIKRECVKEYKNVKVESLFIKKEKEEDTYVYFSFGGRGFGNYGGAAFTQKYLIYVNKLVGVNINDIIGKVVDVRVMRKVYNSKGVEKTNEYIVFDPAEGEEVKLYLYTLESYYKTTLKGYGRDRNYKERLEPVNGSDEFRYDVLCSTSSGSRSGRYGNYYEIIVVDTECKIIGYGEQ